MPREYKRKDRTGDKVGKLTVLKELYKKGDSWLWLCKCDCGNEHITSAGSLGNGNVRSCGCLQKEKAKEMCLNRATHGHSGKGKQTKEYQAWANIKQRTSNPNRADFERYGAIGRVMSEVFFNSFSLFLDEIGEAPNDGNRWSVGRIDNTLGYVEGNLRWETEPQQQRNKRRQVTNTTGLGGVYTANYRGILHYVASWTDLNGNKWTKVFSTKKYGKENALELAKEYRLRMLEELNKNGAGYSETHGK